MTRINCVPPSELSDAHLGAEYRELPRVFALAEAAWLRGEATDKYPSEYVLGPGHVKFFYTRLWYLYQRFHQIVLECQRRGRKTTFTQAPATGLPDRYYQNWTPTPEALALNRQRITERSPKQ
jgi:deoxyribonuclease (pyrimidine dimer)